MFDIRLLTSLILDDISAALGTDLLPAPDKVRNPSELSTEFVEYICQVARSFVGLITILDCQRFVTTSRRFLILHFIGLGLLGSITCNLKDLPWWHSQMDQCEFFAVSATAYLSAYTLKLVYNGWIAEWFGFVVTSWLAIWAAETMNMSIIEDEFLIQLTICALVQLKSLLLCVLTSIGFLASQREQKETGHTFLR